MADSVANEQIIKREPSAPEPDPIADRSMSGLLLVFSLLLILTLIWALFDELFGQKPWRSYQREFAGLYTERLEKIRSRQRTSEKEIKESSEYQELEQKVKEAEADAQPRIQEIDTQVKKIDEQADLLTPPFQDARAWIAAKTYQLEVSESEGSRDSIRKAVEDKKNEKVEVTVMADGTRQEKEMDFHEMEAMYNGLRDEKAQLLAERVELTRPSSEARKKRDDYLQANLVGLTPQQINSLIDKTENSDFRIRQIHVTEGGLVDRCESCHLGIREPVTLTAKDMDGERAFVSHPNKELLRVHDPEKFGCSTCHGGNGRGTTSVEKAHGRYKHWLWPLYEKENVQAGCNTCHNADRITPGADALNHGKDLFQNRGCTGCHRYEGFDRESDMLASNRQAIKELEMQRDGYAQAAEDMREGRGFDRVARFVPNPEQMGINQVLAILNQNISKIDARIDELDSQSKYLMQDQKKVGPNLKEIKAKLRKDWLPVWLFDPQAFRPRTKMPTFRLTDDERKAISAFIWQSALDVKLPAQPPGDANHGKELFKTTGCLGCHSIEGKAIDMGEGRVGGVFAADLSRVGEKANFEYIVRWVHNPRQRLAPYSPSLKRDLTMEDYASKGLPFLFDDTHSKGPVDGRELQVQNMTVMPNFRLSDQDARDIATFLIGQKRSEPQYPDASFMDDKSLFEKGKELTKQYGCAGCHEIRGLEDEQRIGTELTPEGSKPIERLDFALLTEDAKRGVDPITDNDREPWYDHKGFFEYKLRNPAIYDRGKVKSPEERLRMPNIYLEEGDITALTTFLLGSVTSNLPEAMRFKPVGEKRQVQDGWWVVQKYNCMGCHNVLIGQDSILMGLPLYQGADGFEKLPPRLTSEGARVDPNWLLGFLKDPSLSPKSGPGAQSAQSSSSGISNVSKALMQGLVAHIQGPGQPPAQSAQAGQSAQASQSAQSGQGAQAGQNLAQPVPRSYTLTEQPGLNRNGVRSYLQVRMPTFNFSPNELQALVNFFMGASAQNQPYIPERLQPLTAQEQGLARALFTSNAAPCLKCHLTGDPAHDVRATAPNFLLAGERLKPAWTKRWLLDPQLISPGTSMPSELFKRDDAHERWVFNGPTPPAFAAYDQDHVNLLVRYMFQITSDEQRRLVAGGGASAGAAPSSTPAGGANKTAANRNGQSRREIKRAPGIAATRAP